MNAGSIETIETNIALELDTRTLQNRFDIRPNRLEALFFHDLDDGFAGDVSRSTSNHLRVGPADELVSQVTAAPRHSVDHRRPSDRVQAAFPRPRFAQDGVAASRGRAGSS